jgi:hypothetical protein
MFCLVHTTTRHSPPKMTMTFNKLGEYMKKESTSEHVDGREAFSVPSAMAQGMHLSMTGRAPGEKSLNAEEWDELLDEFEECVDDGSLDV